MPNESLRPPTAAADPDPRLLTLRRTAAHLRVALAGQRLHRVDRVAAEQELAALASAAAAGTLEVRELRRALLVLAGALGSLSALAAPLAEVHRAIDLFGPLPATAAPEPCTANIPRRSGPR